MSKRSSAQNEKLYIKAKELAIKGLNETVSPYKRRPSIFYKLDHIMLYGGTIINIIIYLINYFALNLRLEINSSKAIDVAQTTQFRNMSLIAVILLGIAIIITAYKFGKDKCYLFSFLVSLGAIVPMTTFFLLGKTSFELYHGLLKYFLVYFGATILSLIGYCHICYVIVKEKRAINKKYDDILQSIYEQNKNIENGIMTTADWEKAIDDYINNPNGKEKLKKSLRKKEEKNNDD
ncbi:MAG: hypothetical protein IIW73_02885 [Clostridia bacterium]|nr:hypothetical protein [Clostridia bacterium]